MSTSTTLSTLLGALTTTYTPTGSICNSIHYDTNPTGAGWYALGGIGADSTSCMPTGFTRAPQYYYSPGICPSGYTPACSSFHTTNSAVTTVATCCPTGYVCKQNRGNDIYGCTSLVTANTVLTILSVSFETITTGSTTRYPILSGTITTTLSADKTWINAYGVIAARFVTAVLKRVIIGRRLTLPARQSSDPPFLSATATTTTLSASASVATSMASVTSTAISAVTASSSSGGLSTGAKAGIGIGVAVGVIAFILLALMVFKMRQHAKNINGIGKEDNQNMHNYTVVPPSEQPGSTPIMSKYSEQTYAGVYKDRTPVPPHHVSELSPEGTVQELPSQNWTAEMPGDQRYHQ